MTDEKLTRFDQVSPRVRASLTTRDPAPPVYGVVGDERFHIGGVHLHAHVPNTVRISTADRRRFKEAVNAPKRARQGIWTSAQWRMYDGFYVPFSWFDYFFVDEDPLS